jgi:hypothetical protein
MQQLLPLFQVPSPTGRGGGGGGFGLGFLQTLGFPAAGFGFGGGGGATVPAGDYMVSMNVSGKTLKQKLRVERAVPNAVMGVSMPKPTSN